MSEPDIAAVMAAAMDAENRRRELASGAPGLGSLVELPQVSYGPGVGIADLITEMPAVGEGLAAVPHVPQYKAYGPDVPVYAPAEVGGQDYPGGIAQAVQRLGALARGQRSAAAGDIVVVSADAAPRRGLLSRLAARLRRR